MSKGDASGDCSWLVSCAAIVLVISLDTHVGANVLVHVAGTADTSAAADTSALTPVCKAGALAAARSDGICNKYVGKYPVALTTGSTSVEAAGSVAK